MQDILSLFETLFGGAALRFWPIYIPSGLLIAYYIYRRQGHQGGFLSWLFPKGIYFHRSHWVDIQLFAVGRLLKIFGIFQVIAVSSTVAITLVGRFGMTEAQSLSPILISAILLIAADFTVYWIHRIHHEQSVLWPFHAVHHSAEVMTPITVYRKHPVYDIFSHVFRGAFLGLIQGLLLMIFVNSIDLMLIVGINGFYFFFNMLTANFRHSHVWLSFGPFWERIFISPAQHQIHHSSELKHYNKNYGEVLAIWDWMFGTLYIPKGQETLRFGIGDENGELIEQPHPTLARALIEPFEASWAALKGTPKVHDKAEKPNITPAE